MVTKKKKPKYNLNSQIRSALRRVFSRSPWVQEVLKRARIEYEQYNKDGSLAKRPAVRYQCNMCERLFKSTEVQVDHITPVIDLEDGFNDWNTFIDRLFCTEDNLQVLCAYKLKDVSKHNNVESCHYLKTQEDRIARKNNKK